MLSPKQIHAQLQDRNAMAVSRDSGVAYGTVCRIKNGKLDRIAYDTVVKLSNYLTPGGANA